MGIIAEQTFSGGLSYVTPEKIEWLSEQVSATLALFWISTPARVEKIPDCSQKI
jgi:hypothetical protein